jgi:hypothetical protein
MNKTIKLYKGKKMVYINYIIKIAIILIGIFFLTGIAMPANMNPVFIRTMGVIFILYGTYRILRFRTRIKEKILEEDEDEDQS